MMSDKILIVDDEKNVLSSLSRLLRRHQYEVLTAESAQAAFGVLRSNEVAVIISDQKMPGTTGVEFLQQIHQQYPSIIRIILSGYSENEILLDAINQGQIYRYIKKPWDNNVLVELVNQAFHKWRNQWQTYLLNMAFKNSLEGMFFVNQYNKIYWSNEQAERWLEYDSQGLNHKCLSEVFVNDIVPSDSFPEATTVESPDKRRFKAWLVGANNRKIPVVMTATRVTTERGDHHFVYNFYDITDEYNYQKRIEYKAFHDDLTDLPNRSLFHDRVERALVQARRNNWTIVILFLDLDDFKPVNDEFGHLIGDRALKEVAARLIEAVREEDTVARLSGDEFAILLPRFGSNINKLEVFTRKVINRVKATIKLHKRIQFRLGVSIGVVIYPESGETVEQLLNHADEAMYLAKNSGKNRYKIYQKSNSE